MEGAKSNNTPRTPLPSCHVLSGVSKNDVGGQAGNFGYSRCCVKAQDSTMDLVIISHVINIKVKKGVLGYCALAIPVTWKSLHGLQRHALTALSTLYHLFHKIVDLGCMPEIGKHHMVGQMSIM